MIPRTIILGLVAENSPLAGLGNDLVEGIILFALGAVAAYLVALAGRADRTGAGVGLFAAGLVAAAALGYLWALVDGALIAGAAFLLFGGAGMIYQLPRGGELPIWLPVAGVGAALAYAVAGAMAATFALVSTVAVFSAFKVLAARELMHSAVWLAGVLFAVAGAFLALGSPFLAIIQILVYVGAVITLILFTAMLTIPTEESHFLDQIELPPGFTIESGADLNPTRPSMGQGPMKSFDHPRKPTRVPDTLYGVTIADGVFGSDVTEKKIKKEGS